MAHRYAREVVREAPDRQILIAANRGPISFARRADGRVVATRGHGGLVTALSGALAGTGGLWVASALSEEDRARAGRKFSVDEGSARLTAKFLALDPSTYDRFYDGISNGVLWFAHHMLWDLPRTPRFEGLAADWDAYQRINQRFADALAAEGRGLAGARYLTQDYHLALVPRFLRRARPDARVAHFWHIPFAGPEYLAVLPAEVRKEMLAGLLGADVVGFQAPSWADNFLMCCRTLDEATVDLRRRVIRWEGRTVRIRVHPISIDVGQLQREAASPEVAAARRTLERLRGDGALVVRVDRMELSKNVLRGLLAFEALLEAHPDRRGAVTFFAHLLPSRQGVPEYRAYARECAAAAERINRRFARRRWTPIHMSLRDDRPRALAAYQIYDVLMVNPVMDGMNLVAKEGPTLNERSGVLLLSETAGAFAELGAGAVAVNPFDVAGTARALARALDMEPAERRGRARRLRSAVARNPVGRWVEDQLEELDEVGR